MSDPDLVRDVFGIALPPERTAENLAAFAEVLAEIAKLRVFDLSSVHPAVVFRPLSPGRTDGDV